MKETIRKITESRFAARCDRFCNSPWYIAVIGLVCIFAHSLDLSVLGFFFIATLGSVALVFCKNSFTFMPPLLLFVFCSSSKTIPWSAKAVQYYTPWKIATLCVMAAVLIAALVFHIVRYEKWRVIFKRAALTVSLAVVGAALIMNGVGSATSTLWGLGIGVAIAAAMFLPYAFFINCGQYEGKKTFEYFAWIMITASVVVGAGYMQKFIIHDFDLSIVAVKQYLGLGYVGPNTGSSLIAMAMVPTFYFAYRYRHGYWFVLLVAAQMALIVMAHSRASLLVAFFACVSIGVALCFKKRRGILGYYIAFGLLVVGVAVLAIVKRAEVFEIIKSLCTEHDISSSRVMLWKIGFEAWKGAPVFGAGFSCLPSMGYWYYSFHNTVLTYLYCCGLFGCVAYVYHRYRTVRVLFSAKLTVERVFLALNIGVLLVNSLVDIGMARIIHLWFYSTMLALIECDVKHTRSLAGATDGEQNAYAVGGDECSRQQAEIIASTGR